MSFEVHHLAIQVHDLERAVPWYRDLFDLPLLREWHDDAGQLRAVWLKLAGESFVALERCAGNLVDSDWRHDDPGIHVLALRIPLAERARWEARLAARGVEVHHRTQWSLFFRDPEGNRLALSHHPEIAP